MAISTIVSRSPASRRRSRDITGSRAASAVLGRVGSRSQIAASSAFSPPTSSNGPAPGEQLVQDHTKRVHVRRGRHRFATDLLRARVLGRKDPLPGDGERLIGVRREQARDAEIEQLGLTVLGHQDVVGLQVTMHDQGLVCGVDGVADAREELQSLLDADLVLGAIRVDRLAFDILHDEIRATVIRSAAIEQASDARVLHPRQHAPLLAEAPG